MRGRAVALCGLLATSLPACAIGAGLDEPSGFHPYAETGVGYDTNVFRLDDQLLSESGKSDGSFLWTIAAGLDSWMTRGSQQFGVHAVVFHDDYAQLDEVDFTGGNALLNWNWVVGTLWKGTLAYEFRRELPDFANQYVPHVEVKTSNLISAAAERRLSNRWRLGVTADLADIQFTEAAPLDLRRAITGVSLAFDSRKGNTARLDAIYTKKESNGAGGIDYTEFLLGPAVDWHISDRSLLKAELHYTERDENDPELRDYSGFTGRVAWKWRTESDKQVNVVLWREVSSLGDQIANFAIVSGVSIRPELAITPRVSGSILVGYENRNFQGLKDPAALPGQELVHRVDKVLTGVLHLGWRVAGNLELLFDVDAGSRDSTRAFKDYDFLGAQMAVRVGL